jgi:uncharacterized phage protein (TIGR01671 family)
MESRVIKFRGFEPLNNCIIYFDGIAPYSKSGHVKMFALPVGDQSLTDGSYCSMNINNIKLMQFTGLKDTNGLEIYESDILTDEYGSIGIVEWNNDDASFIIKYGDEIQSFDAPEAWAIVKGNIYENKELLTE